MVPVFFFSLSQWLVSFGVAVSLKLPLDFGGRVWSCVVVSPLPGQTGFWADYNCITGKVYRLGLGRDEPLYTLQGKWDGVMTITDTATSVRRGKQMNHRE